MRLMTMTATLGAGGVIVAGRNLQLICLVVLSADHQRLLLSSI